jgi:hypothetical protein
MSEPFCDWLISYFPTRIINQLQLMQTEALIHIFLLNHYKIGSILH